MQTSQAGTGNPAPWAFYTGNHSSKSRDLREEGRELWHSQKEGSREGAARAGSEFPRNKEGPVGAVVQG